MSFIYRFTIDRTGVSFPAPGRLEKVEGAYVVVAEVQFDQAMALQEHADAKQPVTIWVDVGGNAVAFMPVTKIRAKERRGQTVELWALVHMPDAFDQAMGRA